MSDASLTSLPGPNWTELDWAASASPQGVRSTTPQQPQQTPGVAKALTVATKAINTTPHENLKKSTHLFVANMVVTAAVLGVAAIVGATAPWVFVAIAVIGLVVGCGLVAANGGFNKETYNLLKDRFVAGSKEFFKGGMTDDQHIDVAFFLGNPGDQSIEEFRAKKKRKIAEEKAVGTNAPSATPVCQERATEPKVLKSEDTAVPLYYSGISPELQGYNPYREE